MQFKQPTQASKDDYYELVASDVAGNAYSGCCIGVGQIYANVHTNVDTTDLVTDFRTNVAKGFEIFMTNLRNKNGNLAEAATGYRGEGEYDDHCTGRISSLG